MRTQHLLGSEDPNSGWPIWAASSVSTHPSPQSVLSDSALKDVTRSCSFTFSQASFSTIVVTPFFLVLFFPLPGKLFYVHHICSSRQWELCTLCNTKILDFFFFLETGFIVLVNLELVMQTRLASACVLGHRCVPLQLAKSPPCKEKQTSKVK